MESKPPAGRPVGIPAGVIITGEVIAGEDIELHGRVDGQITAPDHHVTIGPSAAITARIVARAVTVAGALDGTMAAREAVRILQTASVRGHVNTPSLMMVEGATFNGTADPARTEAAMLVARYRQKQPE